MAEFLFAYRLLLSGFDRWLLMMSAMAQNARFWCALRQNLTSGKFRQ